MRRSRFSRTCIPAVVHPPSRSFERQRAARDLAGTDCRTADPPSDMPKPDRCFRLARPNRYSERGLSLHPGAKALRHPEGFRVRYDPHRPRVWWRCCSRRRAQPDTRRVCRPPERCTARAITRLFDLEPKLACAVAWHLVKAHPGDMERAQTLADLALATAMAGRQERMRAPINALPPAPPVLREMASQWREPPSSADERRHPAAYITSIVTH